MKKRILSVILTLCLLCTLLPAAALPASAAKSDTDITYPVEGGNLYFDKATGTITDCDEAVTKADIPSEIDGVAVTSIGDRAFNGCSSLTSVTIPDSVTSISERAFYNCSSLTSVTIPDSVTSIGDSAFSHCSSLTSVTIPNSVTSIGDDAFQWCSSLTSVTIPEGVTSIGCDVFGGCSSLTSVTIPNSVTSIADSAFYDCISLASVTIPDSVTSIGNWTFFNCSSLTSVTISDSVTRIGSGAFSHCSSLTAINVAAGNAQYSSVDGILFNKDQSILITYPAVKPETEYRIPNSVTSIGDYAFFDCSNLTSVTIPDSVTGIGKYAFEDCSSLTSVTVPNSVTSIGNNAFSGCDSLTSVTIPESVTNIGDYAFYHCGSLKAIDVAAGNAQYSSVDGILFNKDKSILITYPAVKTETEYSIPNSVTSIGSGAFYGCSSLTSVTIPEGVTRINNGTFELCSSLTSVTIPNSVTRIDAMAFADCISLRSVTIPNSVTRIGGGAFSDCSSLTSVTIPNGVTYIGRYAFRECSSLTSVTIPESVTSISDETFSECSSLTSVTIPESVTSIDYEAFSDCSSLTSVYFEGNAPEIGTHVFQMWDEEAQEYVNIPNLTLYYIEGKDGWTSPTWNGYPTATWDGVHVPHTHSYTAVVTAPTCTEKGYTTHTCECGDSYVDTYMDALGHDYSEWTQTKAPTCTEKGEEKRACSRCDVIETREIEANGHTEVVDAAVPATCTEAGKTEGKHCSVCNTVLVAQETIAALGHDYQDGVCTRCGEKDPDWVEPKPAESYEDVSEGAWYYDAVQYATENGLMNGVGDNEFDPEGSMTRAMLVTVLWRYAGEPMGCQNPFSDVPSGQWYTDAVAWAAANEIVGGVGGNRFDPDGNVTREQMATILFRYANKTGIDTSKRGELGTFPDAGKISLYARDAIAWAVAEGIINGSDGRLLPQGDATRAQVSAILMRFIENIVKK